MTTELFHFSFLVLIYKSLSTQGKGKSMRILKTKKKLGPQFILHCSLSYQQEIKLHSTT